MQVCGGGGGFDIHPSADRETSDASLLRDSRASFQDPFSRNPFLIQCPPHRGSKFRGQPSRRLPACTVTQRYGMRDRFGVRPLVDGGRLPLRWPLISRNLTRQLYRARYPGRLPAPFLESVCSYLSRHVRELSLDPTPPLPLFRLSYPTYAQ